LAEYIIVSVVLLQPHTHLYME